MRFFKRKPKTATVLVPRNDLSDAEIDEVVTDMFKWQEEYTAKNVQRVSFLADRRKG